MLRFAIALSMACGSVSLAALPASASTRIFSFDLEAMALKKALAPATTAVEREQKAAAIHYVSGLLSEAEQSAELLAPADGEAIGRQTSR